MTTRLNPDTVHAPLGRYSHTVKVPPGAEWLVISGQVGIGPNGKVANGVGRQAERAFRNILACLKAHGMAKSDLVKITVFLTDSRHITDFRTARDKVMGEGFDAASTLLIVAGLAAPEMLVEIEATAARAPG